MGHSLVFWAPPASMRPLWLLKPLLILGKIVKWCVVLIEEQLIFFCSFSMNNFHLVNYLLNYILLKLTVSVQVSIDVIRHTQLILRIATTCNEQPLLGFPLGSCSSQVRLGVYCSYKKCDLWFFLITRELQFLGFQDTRMKKKLCQICANHVRV